ncbi:MAG: efflux RND transporter periplasmic adaptor subunit [Rhodospirillales bacterium]|nr:efflux RND transporter periplasmic adaptor subunit [Rhodospirillales bacterium]
MKLPHEKDKQRQRPDGPVSGGSGLGAAIAGLAERFGKPRPLAVAVAVVAVLGLVYLLWPKGANNQAPQFGPPPVTVSKPLIRELIEWKEFTGQFEAVEYVEVRARVSGYLKSVHFEDGKLVTKGDLLFVIEPEPYEIALATAKALLADAMAKVELAKVQLDRTAELRKKSVAAASTYDQRLSELRSATAAVDIAKAAVNTAKLNLDYTRLTAPVSGRISRHEVSVGNLITGGTSGATTLLTTIVTLDPINFIFDVSESDALSYKRAVEVGDVKSARDHPIPVFAQLPDEQQWTRQGTVNFVDNVFNRSSGTIRVRAVFPNPDLFIVPGQFGRVRAPVSKPHAATLIPEAAIASDQSRKIVYVVAADNTVGVKTITLGPRMDGDLRIIRDGLAPDDRVIINGLMRVRPGAKVAPQEDQIRAGAAKP